MIRITSPIFAGDSGKFGLVGPAVLDQKGNLLVLTSRALLELSSSVRDPAGREVGQRASGFYSKSVAQPSAVSLVGWFSPRREMVAKGMPTRFLAVSPRLLGSRALLHHPAAPANICVSAVNSFASFVLPGRSEPIVISGLLRLHNNDPRSSSFDGLAGGIVTTDDNLAIGLVVGWQESDLLVAPLAEVLAAERLELATVKDIKAHNQSIGREPSLWNPKTDGHPEAVLRMLETLDASLEASAHIQQIVAMWAAENWALHCKRSVSAFAPFELFFQGINQDASVFGERLWEFGRENLASTLPDHPFWEDVVSDAFVSAGIDPPDEPIQRPDHSRYAISSLDLVARDEVHADE